MVFQVLQLSRAIVTRLQTSEPANNGRDMHQERGPGPGRTEAVGRPVDHRRGCRRKAALTEGTLRYEGGFLRRAWTKQVFSAACCNMTDLCSVPRSVWRIVGMGWH